MNLPVVLFVFVLISVESVWTWTYTGSRTSSTAAPTVTWACPDTSAVTWADIGVDGSTALCAPNARTYYNETVVGDYRIVITSGIPDHEHESVNPYDACEDWSYMKLPANPVKGTTYTKADIGTVGIATSGGFLFNHLAIITGHVFDDCDGHSDSDNIYHYHFVPKCITGWDSCGHMGYVQDGFPIYGLNCLGNSGETLIPCYALKDDGDSSLSRHYEYDPTIAGCNLDEANGYDFTDGYAYVFTEEYPLIIPGFMGTVLTNMCTVS